MLASRFARARTTARRVCALFSKNKKFSLFLRHPERANKREPKDLARAKQARARCVCAKLLHLMLLYVHGTATLLLRSRNGFALRFARLLRCTSQTSTALRMTRTGKHRGWRGVQRSPPTDLCVDGYVSRIMGLCDYPQNGAAFREHCRGRRPLRPVRHNAFFTKQNGYPRTL